MRRVSCLLLGLAACSSKTPAASCEDCPSGQVCGADDACHEVCNRHIECLPCSTCEGGLCGHTGSCSGECTSNAECDDGDACNGLETCPTGRCESGADLADGTPCDADADPGTLDACKQGQCSKSVCGDKVVDARLDEECDDGNDVHDDGCDACAFQCAAACDDGDPCNGVATCGEGGCIAGQNLQDGIVCEADANTGTFELCKAGDCASSSCGDSITDSRRGEICDDGDFEEGDGCDNDCTHSCTTQVECDNADVCDGAETCGDPSHACVAGSPLDCDDNQDCTADSCDPVTGCANDPANSDSDSADCLTDCDDGDDERAPDLVETCDGKDNDCDDLVDDDDPSLDSMWYADCDGDGYAVNLLGASQTCDAPVAPPPCGPTPAWTSTEPTGPNIDCDDANAAIYPGMTWYEDCDGDDYAPNAPSTSSTGSCVEPATTPAGCAGPEWTWREPVSLLTTDCCDASNAIKPGIPGSFDDVVNVCGSFDNNCDNVLERAYPAASGVGCSGAFPVCTTTGTAGYVGGLPDCGAAFDYRHCETEGTLNPPYVCNDGDASLECIVCLNPSTMMCR